MKVLTDKMNLLALLWIGLIASAALLHFLGAGISLLMFYVLIAVGITMCGLHAAFLRAKMKTNIGQFVMHLSFISLASCTGLAAMAYFNVLKDKWHLIVAPAVISLGYWGWRLLLQPKKQPGSTEDQ